MVYLPLMSDQIQNVISEKVAAFTKELVELYRSALISAVSQVVGSTGGGGAPTGRKRGRPAKRAAVATAAPVRAAVAKPAAKGRGRQRRSSGEIDSTAAKIHKHVTTHPGQRAEDIKKALRIPSNQWGLPVAKLMSEKKIRTTGARRATRYFAGGK